MPQNQKNVGSRGLEQGGPNLGNEYNRDLADQGQENTDVRNDIGSNKGRQDEGRERSNPGSESFKSENRGNERDQNFAGETGKVGDEGAWEESSLLEGEDESKEDIEELDDEDEFDDLEIEDDELEEENKEEDEV